MKATDYGDMIAKYMGAQLVSYECYGSYQGDWLAITMKKDTGILDIWKGSYGSCSGCDWFESVSEYDVDDDSIGEGCIIPDDKVKVYMNDMLPFLSIPIDCIHPDMDIQSLLPANTRIDTYDDFNYENIKEQILKAKEDLINESKASEETV